MLPLAVTAAFGSGFWLVAMRGAVGAIERTQEPFLTWLQESTLLLPVYVLAVLAALALALRLFGPQPRRAKAATTLLLVVAATTLAAIAVQTANAVYDYRLQAGHLATMAAHGSCDAECVAGREESALLLQVRAIGLGGSVMFASNLVLLGLVVGFRGGRLDVASRRHGRSRPSRVEDIDLFVLAGLVGAAVIHASVVPEHLAEWAAAGAFFVVLTLSQVALAAGLVLARSRWAALIGTVVVSDGILVVWLVSRTIGMPFGPEAGVPEPMGVADVAASLLEAATLVLALALVLREQAQGEGALRDQPRRQPEVVQHRGSLALVSVVAVTVIGIGGALGMLGGGHGQEHEAATSSEHA